MYMCLCMQPSILRWRCVVDCVSIPICHRESLSWVASLLSDKEKDDTKDKEPFLSEALNTVNPKP